MKNPFKEFKKSFNFEKDCTIKYNLTHKIPFNNSNPTVDSTNIKNDLIPFYNLLIDLYEKIDDKDLTIIILTEIKTLLINRNQEDFTQDSYSGLLDLMKNLTIYMIPMNLAVFYLNYSSKVIHELKNILFDLIYYLEKIILRLNNRIAINEKKSINHSMKKYEKQKFLIENNYCLSKFLDNINIPKIFVKNIMDVNRKIIGDDSKDFLIFTKLIKKLIRFKEKRSLQNIIDIVYNCVIFNILNKEEYAQKKFNHFSKKSGCPEEPYLPEPF